jgi:hypothetical protein
VQKHPIKICPRCQQIFECKVADIAQCQCQSIIVGAEIWELMATVYDDCLCKNCLLQIAKGSVVKIN